MYLQNFQEISLSYMVYVRSHIYVSEGITFLHSIPFFCGLKAFIAMLSEVAYADEDVFRYYDAIDMSTEQDFEAFHDNISQNALYMLDDIAYGDSCLILSTCDKYKEDGRFVVIAKKIQK